LDRTAAEVKTGGANPQPQAGSPLLKRLLGYLFALLCLVWVFYDVHPQRLLAAMRITNWWFIAVSAFFGVLTYALQGIRWTWLLSPVGRLRPMKSMQAIYVGLFTNEVVPLRFGEVVRAFLASRWIGSGVGAVVPSMVVERFLDALWLAVGIGIAAIFVPLPKDLIEAGDVLGGIVLVATAVFVWLILRKEQELEHGCRSHPPLKGKVAAPTSSVETGAAPRSSVETGAAPTVEVEYGAEKRQSKGKIAAGLSRFISGLARGLREIGLSRKLYGAAALSAGMLACQALAAWFVMLACGLKLPVAASAVVLLIVRLGTAIPNAPANVGSFQFFTVLALGLFGVDKTVAAGFSIVYFAVLTAPLWIIGLFALARTGMTLGAIKREIAGLRKTF